MEEMTKSMASRQIDTIIAQYGNDSMLCYFSLLHQAVIQLNRGKGFLMLMPVLLKQQSGLFCHLMHI